MPCIRLKTARAAVLSVALLLAMGAVARADDAATAGAREHYQKGTSYYDLGRYQEAIREFETAYELKNDPALLYNLAQSHRLAGNTEQALHFYRTYLRRVPKAANRAEIEGRITALEQQAAQKNTTQTTPPPPGTTTTTTTPPPGTTTTTPPPPPGTTTTTPPNTSLPPPVFQTPGTTAPPPGGPAGYVDTAPPPAASDPGRKLRMAGAGTMAVGGLLFGIGLIQGLRAAGAAGEINDAAKMGGTYDPEVERRGKRAQAWEAGLLITGTLIGAGGAALYFYGRRKSEQASPPPMSVTPVASAQSVGAVVRVRF